MVKEEVSLSIASEYSRVKFLQKSAIIVVVARLIVPWTRRVASSAIPRDGAGERTRFFWWRTACNTWQYLVSGPLVPRW